jgi:hypothetical protein
LCEAISAVFVEKIRKAYEGVVLNTYINIGSLVEHLRIRDLIGFDFLPSYLWCRR